MHKALANRLVAKLPSTDGGCNGAQGDSARFAPMG